MLLRKTVSCLVIASQLLLHTPEAFAMRGEEDSLEGRAPSQSSIAPSSAPYFSFHELDQKKSFVTSSRNSFDNLLNALFFRDSLSVHSSDFSESPMEDVRIPEGTRHPGLQRKTGRGRVGPPQADDAQLFRIRTPSSSLSSGSDVVIHVDDAPSPSSPLNHPSRLKQAGVYILGGAAGLAMTPVFLESIARFGRQFGEDLSQDDAISLGFRYASAALLVGDYVLRNHALVMDEREKRNGTHHLVGKALIGSLSVLPALFLYDVESAHAGQSALYSHDQFMGVFYGGFLPLLVNEYLSTREEAFSLTRSREVMTPWKKAVSYGMPIAATLGRFFYGYSMMNMALSDAEMNDDARMAVSMLAGGILSNVMGGLGQVGGLRYLLTEETQSRTWKQKAASAAKLSVLGLLNVVRSLPMVAGSIMGGNALSMPSWLTNTVASQLLLTETLSQTGFQSALLHKRT